MRVASYWASLGFRVDQKELRKVDSTLTRLEKKLRDFGKLGNKNLKINFSIGKVNVDQKRLNTALGNSLDLASKSVVFEVTRFAVNSRALQAALLRAMRGLPPVPPRPGPIPPPVPPRPGPIPPRPNSDRSSRRGLSMGLSANGYGPVMALAAAGYATSRLNTANQELVSNNIAAESVLGSRSKELLDRLSERSDYLGVNYKDTLPQFTKFMASSVPLMGVDSSQQTFESFMQFGRTRGASKVSMNRALTAIGQMSAKGQVMAEELKGQLGDAAGFGEVPQLFAEAYQIQTGGNLTGAKARAALMKAMQDGNVKTADVLPLVTKLMNDLSAGGIEKARNSSTAQQARAENAISGRGGLLQTFSEGGGEEGFSRMWGSFATAMKESKPAVESLTRGFNEISKYASFAMLLPQSFKRAFEGRDSWVADALGAETIANLKSFISGMSDVFSELKKLTSTILDGWGMLVPSIVAFANKVTDVFKYTFKMFNALLPGGEGVDAAANYGRAMQASLAGKTPEEVAAIAAGQEFRPNVANPLESAYGAMNSYNNLPAPQGLLEHMAYRAEQSRLGEEYRLAKIAETQNKDSIYYNDPKGFDAMVNDRMKAQAFDQAYRGGNSSQVNINSGAIVINANTSDPEALSEILTGKLRQLYTGDLEMTKLQFPRRIINVIRPKLGTK